MSARITIDGNLTADPDSGVSTTGTSWAHLRGASHELIKRNGEWTSTDPQFFNVTLLGRPPKTRGDTLHKGDRVTVEGRPELELFDRSDGSTGAVVKVYGRTLTLTNDDTAIPKSSPDITADMTPHDPPHLRDHHVVGVGRAATALHRTLKDHDFRWIAATTGTCPRTWTCTPAPAHRQGPRTHHRHTTRCGPHPGSDPRAGAYEWAVAVNTEPVNSDDRSRHFTANVVTALLEDYRLRPDEAERAVGLFLRRKAGWSTPDQAALEAYRWWSPTVEPSVVLAREAEQRAHAQRPRTNGNTPAFPRVSPTGDDVDGPRADTVRTDLAATE